MVLTDDKKEKDRLTVEIKDFAKRYLVQTKEKPPQPRTKPLKSKYKTNLRKNF
jgi:16S rRNA U516 pseudouridylate synthase RsuA-like enzyme